MQQMCNICKQFLRDFLEIGIQKELPLAKCIQMKYFEMILPDLLDWMYRIYQRLPKEEFDKALMTSARIARRGRKPIDYEYLIQTATFNFLKFQVNWIPSEVDYMKTLLMESGFVKAKESSKAYDYLSYMFPRVYLVLQDLHDDHENPKGLQTDLNKLFKKPKQEQKFLDVDELYN